MSTESATLPTAANFDAIMAERFAEPDTSASDTPELDSSLGAESTDGEQPDVEQTETEQTEQPQESQLIAAAKAAGRMTPELMQEIGDLKIEVKLAGGVSEVAIRDLPNGYMRQAHFQRSMEKANAAQAKADHIFELERARTNSWRNSSRDLYNGLLAMGCEGTLEQVFEYLVQERHAYLTATPEQRAYIDRNKALMRQQAEMQQRLHQLEMQQKQAPAQVDPGTEQAYRYIEQNMDRELSQAFKAANVGKVTPNAHLMFEQELLGYAKMGMSVEDAVRNAATAVADRFAEIKQAAGSTTDGTPPPKPAPAGAPVKRSADGRFVAQSNNKTNKPRPTAAEFAKRFGL